MPIPEVNSHRLRARRQEVQKSGVTLLALGLFPSVSLWAGNVSKSPQIGKLLAIGIVVGMVSLVCVIAVSRLLKASLSTVTFAAGVTIPFLAFWSVISDGLSSIWPNGRVSDAFLALLLACGILTAIKVSGTRSSLAVLSWMAAGLIGGALGQGLVATFSLEPPILSTEATVTATDVEPNPPNIYLVVLDGYARNDMLLELFDYDNGDFTNYLDSAGFFLPRAATANYSMTYASLTSALGMEYPFGSGSSLGPDERASMYEILGGNNPTIATLRNAGYQYFHVESGWGGTRCGDNVDRCFASPFLDESVWSLIQRSVLAKPARQVFGHSFPFNGLDRLEVLPEIVDEVRGSDSPVAVFAHVLLPHPPTFVREDCQIRYDPLLDGFNTGAPWVGGGEVQAARRSAYVDQIRCVNAGVQAFVAAIGSEDDIVILMSDHGTDAGAQLTKRVESWTQADIDERLSPFVAVRLPERCNASTRSPNYMIVNSMRAALRCALDVDLPDLPAHHYVVNVEENFPDDVVLEVRLAGE